MLYDSRDPVSAPWRCLLVFGVISKARNREAQIFLRIHKREKLKVGHILTSHVVYGHMFQVKT